jgi:hypothetical protein
VLDLIAEQIDRKVELAQQYAEADGVRVKIAVATKVHLTDVATARLLNTEVPQDPRGSRRWRSSLTGNRIRASTTWMATTRCVSGGRVSVQANACRRRRRVGAACVKLAVAYFVDDFL